MQLLAILFDSAGPLRLYIIAFVILYLRAALANRLGLFFMFIVPGNNTEKMQRAEGMLFLFKWILIIIVMHFIWYIPYIMLSMFKILPCQWDIFWTC